MLHTPLPTLAESIATAEREFGRPLMPDELELFRQVMGPEFRAWMDPPRVTTPDPRISVDPQSKLITLEFEVSIYRRSRDGGDE
jgi:hypothetical protein